MSGGSYNYLTGAMDLEDLMSKRQELDWMAERLEGLSEIEFPGAHVAGQMTRELLIKLRMWESHAETMAKLLSGVWKSVEWWDSSDWGPDSVREGLNKLLNGEPNA